MADNGGPAFPDDGQADYTGGMTLLDWFAGQALVGMLADGQRDGDYSDYASDAYDYAVAMIAEKRRREAEDGR